MPILAGVFAATMFVAGSAVLPIHIHIHDASFPRIRALDPVAGRLLADGRRRSPTLTALVVDLERRDLVAYVTMSPVVTSRGTLCFVMRAASVTYVIIHINARQIPDRAIAAIGHELRHALEVATAAPAVASAADLAALYRRIGAPLGHGTFESDAALLTEQTIARELARGATRRRP